MSPREKKELPTTENSGKATASLLAFPINRIVKKRRNKKSKKRKKIKKEKKRKRKRKKKKEK